MHNAGRGVANRSIAGDGVYAFGCVDYVNPLRADPWSVKQLTWRESMARMRSCMHTWMCVGWVIQLSPIFGLQMDPANEDHMNRRNVLRTFRRFSFYSVCSLGARPWMYGNEAFYSPKLNLWTLIEFQVVGIPSGDLSVARQSKHDI